MRTKKSTLFLGFTLIELMVVISIIAFLSAIILNTLAVAKEKGRDARRIEDLEQIKIALTLYANDNNQQYPTTPNAYVNHGVSAYFSNDNYNGQGSNNWSSLASKLAPYISSLPVDPLNEPNNLNPFYDLNAFGYGYDSNGTSFDLVTQLEASNDEDCQHQQYITHTVSPFTGAAAGVVFCSSAYYGGGAATNNNLFVLSSN